MRNDVMKRIYSRQLEKRRKDNFRNHAIADIKEETKKQEKIAAERLEAEKRERETSKMASTQAESNFNISLL